ncbi:MAG: response regulator [Clostridiaceae bacterium]|jgi:two-component system response regulator YesN|nr:response regulator [Clostridiaceae bacterium]
MLKCLIVDDEPDICELIHRLIDWEKLHISSLGAVQNGVDAMEIILRQKPDIVITDIQMPGLTGLEIVEKTCAQGMNTKFILISGYREFEYAQQAIRFGVEEYLLKPIRKTDLNSILQRLIQQKNADSRMQGYTDELRNELHEKTCVLRENELRQSVHDVKRVFHAEYFHFQPGEFLCVTIHASVRQKSDIGSDAVPKVLENICARFEHRFEDCCFDNEYVLTDCDAFILLNYPEEQGIYSRCLEVLKSLQRETGIQYQSLLITFAMGLPFFSVEQIGQSIETSARASRLRLYAGTERILEYRNLSKKLSNAPCRAFGSETEREIIHLVKTLQAQAAIDLLDDFYSHFHDAGSIDVGDLFFITRDAIIGLLHSIQEFLPDIDSPIAGIDPLDTELQIRSYLANCDSIDELCDYFKHFIVLIIERCRWVQQQKVGEPVRIAQKYVRDHIDRQVSLEEVSACAFVSAGYLSTLFKEQTGKSFSDFVIETRVETAKRLLLQPELNISQVALRVGYSDSRHFSKVFQKTVGIKPTAYRKFYS